MNLGSKIFHAFLNLFADKERIVGELKRNDPCYCNSGLKFKNCHAPRLAAKRKAAYIVENKRTKVQSVKVMKVRNIPTKHIKSNLRWADIGKGSPEKLDP